MRNIRIPQVFTLIPHNFSSANVVQIYKTKIATICHPNDCDFYFVLEAGLEPAQPQWPRDFKSLVSTDSTIRAAFQRRAENETRTRDPNLGKVMLYQLSYFRVYGCKCREFYNKLQTFLPFSLQKNIFYRPKRLFSACSTAEKLNPFDISSIKPTILSLHKLPILPAWV